MNKKLNGIIASPGIAMGPARIFLKVEPAFTQKEITKDQIQEHIDRVEAAFQAYDQELHARISGTKVEQEVTNAHIELLADPYFLDTVKEKIKEQLFSADWSVHTTAEEMAAMMRSLDDPYLQERGADYLDIGSNLLFRIQGIIPQTLESLPEDCIVIAKELTPSDTSTMDKEHVLGFANDLGGKTSHTSIIAQTLNIPALVGMGTVSETVKDGDFVILDAQDGQLIINPDSELRKEYEEKLSILIRERERLESIRGKAAVTIDGHSVDVACNIGSLNDLEVGIASGTDGVGLFRTEFLYMENTHFPTEEEQFQVYRKAAEMLDGKPLIIRTLDIGGDKGLPYFDFPKEENPFLGWRALRFCFDRPDILKMQLRAILRAGAFGNVKILLPMIISVDELRRVRQYIKECMAELEQEGKPFDAGLEVGIMIETPASVMIADALAKECDYFSIGTNDLTQYILAADRGNEKISGLYNTYYPAVLRAIARVIDAAHQAGKWCGMCGGFAGDPDATYMLLGMGLDEFSVPASKIPKIKDIVLNAKEEEARKFAQDILSLATLEDTLNKIQENTHR
ncbi:MAG: phosphoenolpyruvate--protein phosphotransferase [Peptoniphilaceae bacterium]|nr:phosphoenolpyruvate--protein phosphotransferase [Peptoniphilaceae bacterium]MDY3075920.1 phosphoenolpyruvate--protein phosphotransferase [Peptoniphilaceae bacterium]